MRKYPESSRGITHSLLRHDCASRLAVAVRRAPHNGVVLVFTAQPPQPVKHLSSFPASQQQAMCFTHSVPQGRVCSDPHKYRRAPRNRMYHRQFWLPLNNKAHKPHAASDKRHATILSADSITTMHTPTEAPSQDTSPGDVQGGAAHCTG